MNRTEGISVGVIRMLSQLVGFGPVERAIIIRTGGISVGVITRPEGISVRLMTRTEGISVGVIRMLCQLVGFGSLERANVKFKKKCVPS